VMNSNHVRLKKPTPRGKVRVSQQRRDAMAESKKQLDKRRTDVRDLYEKAGRHLGYALREYASARRLAKAGQPAAAETYRDSGRKYMVQAKRFARQALDDT